MIRRNSSWIEVEFPTKVDDMRKPTGAISQTKDQQIYMFPLLAVLQFDGIHSTKNELPLF